jgi:DNA primase
MSAIPDALIDRVREATDIVALIGEYTPLRRTGASHRGPCPLHGGTGPNFSVNARKGVFTCFTCDAGGNAFTFLMEKEGVGFPDAVRMLAAKAGVPLPEPDADAPRAPYVQPAEKRVYVEPPSVHEENMAALARLSNPTPPSAIYFALLSRMTLSAEAAAYLAAQRKLDPAAARAYGFRSVDTHDDWLAMSDYLATRYRPEELKAAGLGLYTADELEERRLPLELKRVRLPWGGRRAMLVLPYWHAGQVVALRFRMLETRVDPATGKPDAPKYLSLREYSIPLPFNADALGARDVHVVEGELNAYTLAMRPYRLSAIGLAGANAWKPEWSRLLAGARTVIAWFDADETGTKAFAKLRARLSETHGADWVEQRLFHMSGGHDPNELHQQRALRALLVAAPWRARHRAAASV